MSDLRRSPEDMPPKVQAVDGYVVHEDYGTLTHAGDHAEVVAHIVNALENLRELRLEEEEERAAQLAYLDEDDDEDEGSRKSRGKR